MELVILLTWLGSKCQESSGLFLLSSVITGTGSPSLAFIWCWGFELRSSCLLEMSEPSPLPQKASFKISCTNKVLCRQTIKIKSTVLPAISLYLLRGWQHNSLRKFCMRASVFADWSTRCEISGNLSRFSPYIRLPQLNLKFRLGSPLSEQSMSRD